jgi:hypothetical protein
MDRSYTNGALFLRLGVVTGRVAEVRDDSGMTTECKNERPTAGPAWPAGFAGGEWCSGFLWERSIDRDADVEKVQVRDQRAGSRSMDRSYQNIPSFLRLERG